ncbi:putative acyl-CoA synthetase YngI [Tolypocladium ophioglossoides CBS 100239]|uniref:Putative acyl-CoA synthetase YngI n=1 Tax=Tolypocladium ophioglossoides (strain CBS 100239) TaxID=1163406 RepID=A0A0L0MYK5_TOLOC|nr:putative acyl-CoA synthetase YngI [Tolypocladium ophioglossoides CBS 100239]
MAPSPKTPSTSEESESTRKRAETFGTEIKDLHLKPWDILSTSAANYPDREALVSLWQPAEPDEPSQHLRHPQGSNCLRLTYGALHGRAERLAASLAGLGCGPGMHLAAIFWNSAEWGLFFWAAARLGMVFVPIDVRAGGDMQSMLAAVNPQVVVVQDADITETLTFGDGQLRTPPIRIHCSRRPVDGWLAYDGLSLSGGTQERGDDAVAVSHDTLPRPEVSDESIAFIIFTSGTTGTPKGCPHTCRSVAAQTHEHDPNEDHSQIDRWLVHTPVSHIFAVNNALRAWRIGHAVVFPSKSFDVGSTVQALVQEKCTVMSATPTLVKALLAHEGFPDPKDLNISYVTIGGTSIGFEDIQLCRQGLGAKDAIQAYGMSEGAPLVSWSRKDPMLTDGFHPGIGKALPGVSIRICEPGTRKVLDCDEVGELHVGGPSVISSYLGGLDGDGFYTDDFGTWLASGDQARLDQDGVLYITGRYKELIIRGGENIHPARIESALAEIPGLQASVVGIPDTMAGQLAVAVVQLPQGTTKVHVAEKARALGPKYALNAVHTLEELGLESFPVTSLGKPKKGALAKTVIAFCSAKRPPAASSIKRDQQQELTETLTRAWEKLTGDSPSKDDNFAYLSDSITLLRYCDSVSRHSGRRLYLQDLVEHVTIEKQAKMLLERADQQFGYESGSVADYRIDRNSSLDTYSDSQPSTSSSPRTVPAQGLLAAAQEQVSSLGLDECKVEDVITVRESLQRMISGQRLQSFHVRVVFRVSTATKDQIRRGIEKGLGHRPMLRAIACRPLNAAPFHAILGPHEQLFDRQIREMTVRTEQEANELCSDDRALRHSSDFMFTVDIITIQETDQCYLSLTYNHSIMDAVFLVQWHRDLGHLISGVEESTSPMQRSYGLFADLYDQYRDSLPAQESVSFHVRRLRGISRFKQALWPPQRAPGWMVSNDETSPHAQERRRVREQVWDGTWDRSASEFHSPRRSRVVYVPQLAALRRDCGVDPAMFARCAVTIFNVLQTSSPCAVFTSWESGRSWPFVPDWIQRRLPPPMSIDGPTVGRILNMVGVSQSETVREFFKRMTLEYAQARRHDHVLWDKVVSELREEGPVAVDASFRQSFVWDVSMGMMQYRQDNEVLDLVSRHDWADFGLCWNMFAVGKDNIFFIASWDTAQMNVDEVERHCDNMAKVMRRLAKEANWDRSIADVFTERA